MSVSARLATLVVAAVLLMPAVATAQDAEHTLSVLGNGQVEVKPDRGSFTVVVQRIARKANAARGRANARVKAIVGGLKAAGVPGSGINTAEISINRDKYRERKDGPVKTRFRATVAFRVTVDGIKVLGRAIDAASKRGASDIYGPQLSFTPAVREAAERGAEAAALADARERADAAAAATGQRIVGVAAIDLDPDGDGFSNFAIQETSAAGGAADRASAPTRVFAAKRKVTSEVRVAYLIEPAA